MDEGKNLKIAIKLTGYIFDLESIDGVNELDSVIQCIKKFCNGDNEFYIIIGGGKGARRYIQIGRDRNAPESVLDILGIMFSRINAQLLISLIGDKAYPDPLKDLQDAARLTGKGNILVFGGLIPGISTNAVSALVAEHLKADMLITMTRAGALYTNDPEKDKNAKPLSRVTVKEVRKILTGSSDRAGHYPLIDQTALSIISRSKIPTRIIGSDAKSLVNLLKGEKIGTEIYFD